MKSGSGLIDCLCEFSTIAIFFQDLKILPAFRFWENSSNMGVLWRFLHHKKSQTV